MIEMHHYITKTKDGLYHVTNAVGGMLGQHHCHTQEGYRFWVVKGKIGKEYLHISKGTCDCGLKPGFVRSHDGIVTFNSLFV